jgi:class 3 adenylate cyclase
MVMRRDAPGDKERGLQLVGEALDAAQELGMVLLMEQALTLKLKAQGIDLKDLSTSIDAVHATVQTERPDLRPHAAPDGTVTLLFTDIEGSTALNERLGDQRWMELLRAHNAIVRERVAAHGGYEVKSQGDGFMIAFAGARRALQCAIDLQRAIAKHNRAAPEPVRVRIGLHTGDAIREGEDFFGKHVNLAARIAGEAKGGEILASSLLAELAGSAGQFAFGEARTVALKGLAGEHSVIPVAWQPSPTTSPSATV